MDWTEKQWRDFCQRLPIEGPTVSAVWALLSRTYAGRAYHNIQHVGDMIHRLHDANERPRVALATAFEYTVVEAAIWFHDVIYDVRNPIKGDNEEQSAQVAMMFLRGAAPAGVAFHVSYNVYNCIIATTHTCEPRNPMENAIVDLDLLGLASERQVYIGNSRRIREEYAHVADLDWWKNRGIFLRWLLGRNTIYRMQGFRDAYEQRARENMAAELEYVNRRLQETA